MKTTKLLSAASGAVLALGVATSGLGPSPAAAQGYGAPPPPPPSYAPPPPPSYRPPSSYEPRIPNESIVKVCKVGQGIPLAQLFPFHTKPDGGKGTVLIPAGPPPSGWCQVIGTYPVGTQVDVLEFIPSGYGMDSVAVEPANAEVSHDLDEGRITLKVARGVTEVTVRQSERPPGWIEICKAGGREGMYQFTFKGMNGPQTTDPIPSGTCTPAIQVPSGRLVVTEVNGQGQMTGGLTWPADRLIQADNSRGEVSVRIYPGTIATQTIITFQNRGEPPRKGY